MSLIMLKFLSGPLIWQFVCLKVFVYAFLIFQNLFLTAIKTICVDYMYYCTWVYLKPPIWWVWTYNFHFSPWYLQSTSLGDAQTPFIFSLDLKIHKVITNWSIIASYGRTIAYAYRCPLISWNFFVDQLFGNLYV